MNIIKKGVCPIIYLINDCDIFAHGINSMLSSYDLRINSISKKTLLDKETLLKDSIIIYPLINNTIEEHKCIFNIKSAFSNCKMLIIDFVNDKNNFLKLSSNEIDGYLLGSCSKVELFAGIYSLIKNKAYSDKKLQSLDIKCKEAIESEPIKVFSEVLTFREKQILLEIASGASNLKIAESLKISENTVKKHISNLFTKINVKDRTQATIFAYDNGLLSYKNNITQR